MLQRKRFLEIFFMVQIVFRGAKPWGFFMDLPSLRIPFAVKYSSFGKQNLFFNVKDLKLELVDAKWGYGKKSTVYLY